VEDHRLGTAHRPDAGGAVHVQVHLAAEVQRAFHHRARADDDALPALGRELEPAGGALDRDAATDVRVHAHGDVAGARLDVAGRLGGDQADGAVDGLHAAADHAAAVHEHPAVDGLDAAAGAHVAAQADGAVDGLHAVHLGTLADGDAAVDGADVFGLDVLAHADAAVDRLQVAVGLAGRGLDAAVDLADVVGGGERRSRHGQGEGKGKAMD